MRILIPIIILATLFNFGCSKQEQQQKAPPKVIVCPATEQKVKPTHTMVGQAVALEQVALRARITGFIEKQPVEDGAFVNKGDIIFLIQKTQYEAEVLSAQGSVEKAQAALENATINYNRQKYLAAKQAVSQRAFDIATAQLGDAQGELKLAQASLIEAKLNLSYTEIIAPFKGKIGIPAYDPGNLVSPDSDALVEIVMLDPMLIQFNLVEQNLLDYIEKKYSDKNLADQPNKVSLAENIVVKLMLSNEKEYPLTGTIDYSDNVIDPLTGSILIRAIFKNPQKILIPGSYVNVILEKKESTDALLVPQDAIQTDQVGSFVYVLDKNNTVKYVSVTVGAVYGIGISVKNGLKAGDLVVFQGVQKIRDGMKVTPKTVKISDITDKADNNITKSNKTDVDSSNTKPSTGDETDTQKIINSSQTALNDKQNIQNGKNKSKAVYHDNAQSLNSDKKKSDTVDKKADVWKYRDGSKDLDIEKEIVEGDKQIKKTGQNIKKIVDEKIVTTEVEGKNGVKAIAPNELKKLPALKTIDSNELNSKQDNPKNQIQHNNQNN